MEVKWRGKESVRLYQRPHIRAGSPKYQLHVDLEIVTKSNFSRLAQNEALRALVTKILF